MTNADIFKYELKKVQWIGRLFNYWNNNKLKIKIDIKQWQIFEVDFGINVGAEFSGRHYGVCINKPTINNPLIIVIPIKTAKDKINPYSDVFLGKINGIESLNNSLAVINQITTIDKLRIFDINTINNVISAKPIFLTKKQRDILINSIKSKILIF